MQLIDPKIYYSNLPRKRMAVAALLFNSQGQVLIVKPSYKNHWSLPGGVVEKDESLQQALLREIKEEINLDFNGKIKLAVLDYCSGEEKLGAGKTESLQIFFDCGIISKDEEMTIRPDGEEIIDYQFCSVEEAKKIISEPLKKRIESYLSAGMVVYLENGEII